MSSPEDASPPAASDELKKKKKQRACDFCRRKKIRCDGAEMPDHRCTRCIGQGIECTYEPINTRPPSKSYVQILENRLQNMERLFTQLHPNAQLPKDFDGVIEANRLRVASDTLQPSSSCSPISSAAGTVSPAPPDAPTSADSEELDPSDDEREAKANVLRNFRRIPVPHHGHFRWHGKSSNLMFLQTVLDLKDRAAGIERPRSADPVFPPFLAPRAPPSVESNWLTRAMTSDETPYDNFPARELIDHLADKYFENMNNYLPLLHRPTFNRGLNDGLHFRDRPFGAIVFLVCANGSRWSSDSRIPDDGRFPGWTWFQKVEHTRWMVLERPKLEDLQTCALMATYLACTNVPQGSWTIIGLGIRMAQDIGIHRKKMYSAKPTVNDELWKRVFWILVTLDRMGSIGLGRPCAIHDEDFDLDPMLEVDDEYWENDDPDLAFKQPEGKPSSISFVNCFIQLQKVLTFASRTIYSINKSKLSHGFVGPEWEQRIVAELDSALNKWIDTVPDHLKWDPDRQHKLFMNQSASLYANYYLAQVCVHRPFIPSPRKPSRLPFPSLTICTNAARSCTHVLDVQFQKTGDSILLNRLPLFTAGLVLLLNMWGSKKSGLPASDPNISDVRKCMHILKGMEKYTYSAGRLWDVLQALVSMGEFPVEATQDVASLVANIAIREHGTSVNMSTAGLSPLYSANDALEPTPAASSSGIAEARAPQPQPTLNGPNGIGDMSSSDMQVESPFVLPIHTAELGRMSFYQGLNPEFTVTPPQQQPPAQTQAQDQTQAQHAFFQSAQGPTGLATSQFSPLNYVSGAHAGQTAGTGVDNSQFSARLTEYSELLSALNAAPMPHAQAQAPAGPFAMPGFGMGAGMGNGDAEAAAMAALAAAAAGSLGGGAGPSGGMGGDGDVPMMSAESFAFPDGTMEMWSSAPTSFEWNDWGAYLGSMSGMNNPFTSPPGSL